MLWRRTLDHFPNHFTARAKLDHEEERKNYFAQAGVFKPPKVQGLVADRLRKEKDLKDWKIFTDSAAFLFERKLDCRKLNFLRLTLLNQANGENFITEEAFDNIA